MSKKKEVAKPEVKAFTEITVGQHVIPVVPTLDDLPRAARRLLRDVAGDSGAAQLFTNGPRFQMAVDYCLAYCSTQGISINLSQIEDEAEYDRTRMQAVTSGFTLMGHFNKAAEADPKVEENPEAIEAEKSN